MKSKFYYFLLLIIYSNLHAQKQVFLDVENTKQLTKVSIFKPLSISNTNAELGNTFISNNSSIQFIANGADLLSVEKNQPKLLNLAIPISNTSTITLELIPIDIFGDNYNVINAQNSAVSFQKGVFYKGIVKGDNSSLVSLNIINGEMNGFIATNEGNFVLGRLKNSKNYIYYNDKELKEKQLFNCGLNESEVKKIVDSEVQSSASLANVACRAVQVYFEADNAIYNAQNSDMPTTINFVNSLFSQVAVLYNNEGISIQISQLKVWDTADPYISSTTTSAMLSAFGTQVGNTFVGDLAHLISGRSLGGGVAWLDVLCSKGKGISANIANFVENVPTFTWNIEVVTHEMGHNFGSPHTHSCSWPGGAIDNCGPNAGYPYEGTCSNAPTPTNGGTIMSYCHLVGTGINFNNGFGLLPGNLLRKRTQSCMGSAVAPTNLAVLDVYSTSVFVVWLHASGGNTTVEYKPTSSTTWTSLTTNLKSIEISGLTANTTYNWRVKVGCSTFVTSTFTTNSTPPISYCAINYSTGCNTYSIGINDVIIGGVNYNPSSGCTSSGGYDFIFNSVRNLVVGQTYTVSLTLLWNGNPIQGAIWIDLNKNGTYENSEKLFATTSNVQAPALAITGSFTIPAGSPLKSKTRMRVVTNFSSTPSSACGNYGYGETEEFLVNIVNNSNCGQSMVLVNPTDNISSGNITKQVSATNGLITATNFITGASTKATYQAKSIQLNRGFKVDKGSVFKAEIGGCN